MGNNSRDEKIRYVFEATGNEQLDAVGKSLEGMANGASAAAPAAQQLLDQFNKLTSQTGAIDKFVELKAAAAEVTGKLQDARKGLADLNSEFDRADTSSGRVNATFAKAEAQVAALTGQHNKLSAQVATAGGALRAAGIDTDHLDTAHRGLQQSMTAVTASAGLLSTQHEHLSEATRKTGEETSEAGKKAGESATLFGSLKEHLAEIISIAAAVELALKGIEFGKESLKGAEDIEASLSRVKALAKGTSEDFGELDDAVEKAAKAVNVSSQESAGGLAALAARGLDAKSAIAALIPTLQLAKIANIDQAQAADLVAESLKAFNLPATEAQSVVDKLTAASHGSAGGLASIATAAKTLAPDARALGISFDQTVAVLGLLEARGLDGEKSLKGLRTVMQDLENPTSKLRTELLALGDGTNDFGKAITTLSSGTPRANEALLSLNGSARSVVLALGQLGPNALEIFSKALAQTQGQAARTASTLDDNLRGATARFTHSIDDVGEKLAKPLLEPLTAELVKLSRELNEFAESPSFKEIQKELSEIVKEGIEKLDKALHDFDWPTFAKEAKEALAEVRDDLKAVGDTASVVAKSVGVIADAVGAAYHVAGAGIDLVVEAGAKVGDVLVSAAEKGDALAEGTEKAARGYEDLHAAFQSVAEEAGGQFSHNIEKATADIIDITGAEEGAVAATEKHGAAAATAASKVQAHGAAAGIAKVQVADLTAKTAEGTIVVGALTSAHDKLLGDYSKLPQAIRDTAVALAEERENAGLTQQQIENLATALNGLGVKSQASLNQAAESAKALFGTVDKLSAQTAAGLADRQNAFLAYAKAVLAANQNLDEGAQASARYQLESKASALGVLDALEKLENQGKRTGDAIASGARDGADALQAEAQAADRATQSVDHFATTGEEGFATLTQGLANARAGFLGVSQAAADFYDRVLKGSFDLGHSDDGAGFDRVARAMTDALNKTNEAIAKDKIGLEQLVAGFNDVGKAGTASLSGINSYVNGDIASMQAFIAQIDSGTFKLGLLGQQDLAPLRAALEEAINREKELQRQADEAKKKFDDLAQSTEDAFDEASGNKGALEDRRHQKMLKDLYDAAKEAGKLNTFEYDMAVARENALHKKKLDDIEDEQKAAANPPGSTSGKQSGSAGGGGVYLGAGGVHRMEVHVNGVNLGNLSYFDQQKLANQLLPHIVNGIAQGRRNAGGYAG